MNYRNKTILVLCISILLFGIIITPITSGTNINISEISKQKVRDDEKGLMFLWLMGHLKDVISYENETLGVTVYEGIVVNGGGIVFCPKLSLIPLPAFLQKGDAVKIFKGFPELHTRIIPLPNNQILFNQWFFGFVYINKPENEPYIIEHLISNLIL